MEKLKLIGFWAESKVPSQLPHPRNFVQPGWEAEHKQSIVNYLRQGLFVAGSWDYATNRFEDGRFEKEMGSALLSDGVYLWPEGLAIYVDAYDVRLPDEVVDHMKAQKFTMPEHLLKDAIGDDCEFWESWARNAQRMNPAQ